MTSIGELFITLGFDADTQAVKDFDKYVNNLVNTLGTIAATTAAAIVAVDKFTDKTLSSVASMRSLSIQTDLSMQELKRWGLAANMADVTLSADQAMSSIQSLQNNLAQIRQGEGNVAPFQKLGIDTTGKNAIQILQQLRGAISGLDNSTATNLISQTGLSPQFISLLRMGSSEFEQLNKQMLLSGEQYSKVMQVTNAFNTLKINIQMLTEQLVAKMTPELNELIDSLSKFAPYFIKALGTLIAITAKFATMITRVLSVLKEWGGYLPILIGGATTFNAVLAITNKQMLGLINKTSLLLMGLIALFGILEDIQVWKSGGQSLLGELFGPYKKEYDAVLNTLRYGSEFLGGVIPGATIGGMVGGVGGVTPGAIIGGLAVPLTDVIMQHVNKSDAGNKTNSDNNLTMNITTSAPIDQAAVESTKMAFSGPEIHFDTSGA